MEEITPKIYTVSEISKIIKETIEENIGYVFVKGEISNFKAPVSGHYYFTLKDKNSQIKIAFFKRNIKNLNFELKDGQKVIVGGLLSIYDKRSEYQIIAEDIQLLGIGELLLKFEELKKKLEKKGLFRQEHKKSLPEYPEKIGIITSKTGAAIRDILNIIKRRYSNLEILIYPVLVQGEEAPSQIIQAINDFNNYFSDIDLIILTRGGGSIEDLWAFNSEELAYTIYNSKIPIVSAVGHEIDITISDLVADLRAPTPSAAAELVVPDTVEILNTLSSFKRHMFNLINNKLKTSYEKLKSLRERYAFKIPSHLFDNYVQTIDEFDIQINDLIEKKYLSYEERMNIYSEKLKLLNPLNILKKGYSMVYDKTTGKLIKDADNVKLNSDVYIKLYKGSITAKVKEKRGEKDEKK